MDMWRMCGGHEHEMDMMKKTVRWKLRSMPRNMDMRWMCGRQKSCVLEVKRTCDGCGNKMDVWKAVSWK